MAGPAIRVVGADTLARTLRAAGAAVADLEHDEELADAALAPVRAAIPVRTGRLRSSARSVPVERIPSIVVGEVYAAPINYGWPARGIAASRFAERGATAAGPPVAGLVRRKILRILSRLKGA